MQLEPRIGAGARLTLVVDGRRLVVRALADAAPDTGRWVAAVPVLADVQVCELDGRDDVQAELSVPGGLATAAARVVSGPLGTVVRLGPDAETVQRRDDVRGAVELEVLLAVPDGSGPPYGGRLLPGRTLNISGGGLLARLESVPEGLRGAGAKVTAELTLPGDSRVTTVLEVLEVHGSTVRASFAAIERRAQQRLVNLVFARERAQLRGRTSDADHRATGGPPGLLPQLPVRPLPFEPDAETGGDDDAPLAEVRPLIARRRP